MKKVGQAGTMPGTGGFTIAMFHKNQVPVGTDIYIMSPSDELPEYQETVRQARLWRQYKHLFEKMHEVTEAMSPLIHFRLQMEDAKNERLPQL